MFTPKCGLITFPFFMISSTWPEPSKEPEGNNLMSDLLFRVSLSIDV